MLHKHRWLSLPLVLLALPAVSLSPAWAHGGHSELLKVSVTGSQMQFDTHIAASLLGAFDRNQDNRLTKQEFLANVPAIKAWLQAQIQVQLDDGSLLQPEWFDLPVSEGDVTNPQGEIKHLHLIQRYRLPATGSLQLQLTLRENTDKTLLLFRDDSVFSKHFGLGPISLALR